MSTLETKVANTVLEKRISVKVGKEQYLMKPPTLATLIAVSAEISELPKMDLSDISNGANITRIMHETLKNAKYCKGIARVLAIMINGVKKTEKGGFWHRLFKSKTDKLADKILTTCTPTELLSTYTRLLGGLQLGDFFGLISSLNAVNLTGTTTTPQFGR